MHVLIDDVRDLEGMDIICRNSKWGIQVLKHLPATKLYIDHDLGNDDINGYQVIMLLQEINKLPNEIQIVSSNPVGQKNITAALISFGYTIAMDGRNFKK